jgi:formate dehydrogenase iron-sulfur subunit
MNQSPLTDNSTSLTPRKIFVSLDTSARSKGSDKVAIQVQKVLDSQPDLSATLVRNGSRCMLWLEPLLEVNTPRGHVAYGPATPKHVKDILNQQCFIDVVEHPLCLSFTRALPWLKS